MVVYKRKYYQPFWRRRESRVLVRFLVILIVFMIFFVYFFPKQAEGGLDETLLFLEEVQHPLSQQEKFLPLATDNQECIRLTQHENEWAHVRLIIFQRDGGLILSNAMLHHLRVLHPNNIVLIDHQGRDGLTASILHEYAAKGVHVWRCTGPWARKNEMWTDITLAYANTSDYVFPLDADEYLVAFQGNETSFAWTKPAFDRALRRLGHSGKPFRTAAYRPIPLDCGDGQDYSDYSSSSLLRAESQQSSSHGSISPQGGCNLKFAKLGKDKFHCHTKTFARGSDFLFTDTGNHYGGTRKFPEQSNHLCRTKGYRTVNEVSRIAILHLSPVTFNDWFAHILRGAADYGYNQVGYPCETNASLGHHYCYQWRTIAQMKFNTWEMRKYYNDLLCPKEPLQPDTYMEQDFISCLS